MAEKGLEVSKSKTYEVDPIERAWIATSLGTQLNVLNRSRQKEMHGGEVWRLRGEEIKALDALIGKFS